MGQVFGCLLASGFCKAIRWCGWLSIGLLLAACVINQAPLAKHCLKNSLQGSCQQPTEPVRWPVLSQPALQAALQQGLQQNLDMAALAARLDQNRFQVLQGKGLLWPSLNLFLNRKNSAETWSLEASIPVDARAIKSIQSLEFEYQAGAFEGAWIQREMAQQILAAGLALTYLHRREQILQQRLDVDLNAQFLHTRLYSLGEQEATAVSQHHDQVQQSQHQLQQLFLERQTAQRQVAALLNQEPDSSLWTQLDWSAWMQSPQWSKNWALALQQDPRVLAAWSRIEAAQAEAMVLQRARFPSFTLTANWSESSLGTLLHSWKAQFLALMAVEIFGANTSRWERQRLDAVQQERLVQYADTVQSVLQAALQRMAELQSAQLAQTLSRQRLAAHAQRSAIQRTRYFSGETGSALSVLEHHRQKLVLELDHLDRQYALIQANLAVFFALNGDFKSTGNG